MSDELTRESAQKCGWRRCRRAATQGFGVWSWFEPTARQTPTYYEVCDKHAEKFTRSFDSTASDEVKAKCAPTPVTDDKVVAMRREQERRYAGV